jgi:hypothetical protein
MSLTSYRAAPPRVPGRRLYLIFFCLRKRKLCGVRNLRGVHLRLHSRSLCRVAQFLPSTAGCRRSRQVVQLRRAQPYMRV